MQIGASEVMWALDRMAKRTEVRGECWVWTGYTRNGYGSISVRGCLVYIHALSFAVAQGEQPESGDLCHSCDVRPCWQPGHLSAGSRLDNIMDARRKGRMPNPPRVAGERQHLAVLTDDEVAQLREAWERDHPHQRDLAAAFGVSQSTVWRLVHRKVRAQ